MKAGRSGKISGRPGLAGRAGLRKKEGRLSAKKGRRASGKRTRMGVRHLSKRLVRHKRQTAVRQEEERQTAAEPGSGSPVQQEHGAAAFNAGYELGLYEGGEEILEQTVPQHVLLPDANLRNVIAAGVGAMSGSFIPLMGVHEVFAEMEQAIAGGAPCAVVRLGDGELLALSQGVVYDEQTVRREGRFLPYAGVNPPDLAARDQLVLAVRNAGIVGVPLSRRKHFQPLLHGVLRGHGIDPASLRMTTSTINYGLYQEGLLQGLLTGKRLLLIGNAAPQLAQTLQERGYHVTGVISPVNGFPDIERAVAEAQGAEFDLALISAGIPAVVLSWRIAAEKGKVALDFGHMADSIIKGQVTL